MPTDGNCTGFGVVHLGKGHFSDVDLADLSAALFYDWTGPIFEENGALQVIIDERADDAQRDGLRRVLHGEEMDEAATHWWVYHAMSSAITLNLDESYGQWNILHHSSSGVVR